MNWFQRHLNWSLFFGTFLLPFCVGLIFTAILAAIFWGQLAPFIGSGTDGLSEEVFTSVFFQWVPIIIIAGVVNLALFIFAFIVAWWYLGQKARSKWFLLLFLLPGVLSGIYRVTNSQNIFFALFILVVALICAIIFYRLENRRIGYGGDFIGELETVHWQDSGHLSVYDRQQKELEYRDIGVSRDVRDAGDVKDVSVASVETSTEDKVPERPIKYEPLKMPILLDDAGQVIRCFYHPGADAVNLCSRCGQYVCRECNYVTGTHPICRNCWEKRAAIPVITAPAERQKNVEPGKSEKQKSIEVDKSEKRGVEKSEWFQEFMELYDRTSPIINGVIRKSTDGMPASPLDLMEGLKLRPILERTKKLSKPKSKELVEARKEFEQVLSSCIKIADAAADFVSGGGQAMLGGPDYKRIVDEIEIANGVMEKLSQRLTSFS